MTVEQKEIVRQLRGLLKSRPEWMLHDFRVQQAHENALMEDAEMSNAPDGTMVGIWTLWTDCRGGKHWLYAGTAK